MINADQPQNWFDFVYNADGTCHFWYCGRAGVILAYDDMSPEFGHWFCARCWQPYEEDDVVVLRVLLDMRPYIGPEFQLPELAESRCLSFAHCACPTDDSRICIAIRYNRDIEDVMYDETCQCMCHCGEEEEDDNEY